MRDEHEVREDSGHAAAERDRDHVARGRVAPYAPVHAERDERDVANREQDWQRREEDRALELRAQPSDDEHVRGEQRGAHDDEVDDDLDETPGLEHDRVPERGVARLRAASRALLEIAEEAPELDEQDERHEHAEGRQAAVVEDVVRERGRADRRRDEREQEHGLRLREAVVDEPVRRVVAAALRHGPALREPHDRDEGRVEDRDREDEQREEHGRDRRPGDRPARRERERREREAEHLAPRVAHEHVRGAAGPQVEREEAGAREPEREREHEHGVVRMLGCGVDREVAARDRRERRGEPVHVVEEVEGVRDPDEPEDPDRPREDVVPDDLDLEPAREHDDSGADLERELDDRAQVPNVVEEAGGEEERAAGEDPAELAAPLDGAGREREPDGRNEPGEDADPAERRRRRSCQRSPLGCATSRSPRRDRRRTPENRDRYGKRGDRDDRFHNQERVIEPPVALDSSP